MIVYICVGGADNDDDDDDDDDDHDNNNNDIYTAPRLWHIQRCYIYQIKVLGFQRLKNSV